VSSCRFKADGSTIHKRPGLLIFNGTLQDVPRRHQRRCHAASPWQPIKFRPCHTPCLSFQTPLSHPLCMNMIALRASSRRYSNQTARCPLPMPSTAAVRPVSVSMIFPSRLEGDIS
jgi:hypothetical protein